MTERQPTPTAPPPVDLPAIDLHVQGCISCYNFTEENK